jgi:hypothetical protein
MIKTIEMPFIISEKRAGNRLVNIGVVLATKKRDARLQAAHKWPGRLLIKPRPWSSVKPRRRLFAILATEER